MAHARDLDSLKSDIRALRTDLHRLTADVGAVGREAARGLMQTPRGGWTGALKRWRDEHDDTWTTIRDQSGQSWDAFRGSVHGHPVVAVVGAFLLGCAIASLLSSRSAER